MEVFELNTKVISGVDCLEYFNQYKNQGIFIVCDKFLAENQSVTKILKEIDDSNKVVLFTDVVPDPPLEEVAAGMKRLMASSCDVIVAFGGGSAIDAAKAILFLRPSKRVRLLSLLRFQPQAVPGQTQPPQRLSPIYRQRSSIFLQIQ